MEITAVARRIKSFVSSVELLYAHTPLELLTTLHTLDVASTHEGQFLKCISDQPTDASLQLIWEALQLNLRHDILSSVTCIGHGDVIIYSPTPMSPEMFERKLRDNPDTFRHTRGFAHYLEYIESVENVEYDTLF